MALLNRRYLYVVLVLQLIFFASFGQSGSIHFDMGQPPVIKQLGKEVSIKVTVSHEASNSQWISHDTIIDGSVSGFDIKNLMPTTYYIGVAVTYIPKIGTYNGKPITGSSQLDVVVGSGVAVVSDVLKKNCKYYSGWLSDKCPKCHSNINVVPVCRGHVMIDPTTGAPVSRCHESMEYDGSPKICQPLWYCEKDKLEF